MCHHILSRFNQETVLGHILLDLAQSLCLLLRADICLIYCCTDTTDVDFIMILLLSPFLSIFLLLQISLWLLKSPIIMKDLGNCSINLFSSDSLSSSQGEYILNTLLLFYRELLI